MYIFHKNRVWFNNWELNFITRSWVPVHFNTRFLQFWKNKYKTARLVGWACGVRTNRSVLGSMDSTWWSMDQKILPLTGPLTTGQFWVKMTHGWVYSSGGSHPKKNPWPRQLLGYVRESTSLNGSAWASPINTESRVGCRSTFHKTMDQRSIKPILLTS